MTYVVSWPGFIIYDPRENERASNDARFIIVDDQLKILKNGEYFNIKNLDFPYSAHQIMLQNKNCIAILFNVNKDQDIIHFIYFQRTLIPEFIVNTSAKDLNQAIIDKHSSDIVKLNSKIDPLTEELALNREKIQLLLDMFEAKDHFNQLSNSQKNT